MQTYAVHKENNKLDLQLQHEIIFKPLIFYTAHLNI